MKFFFFAVAALAIVFPLSAQNSAGQSPVSAPAAGASSDDKDAVRVPFDLYGNYIFVQASINNSAPLWWVFDSGSNVNVINSRIAQKLALVDEKQLTIEANGGDVGGSLIENTTINIAGAKAANQKIVAAALDPLAAYAGREVQGIIGNNFIQNFVVEIDYARHELIFHNPQNYNLASAPEAIPIENRNGTPFIKGQLTLDDKNVIDDSFEIDTGSSDILEIYHPFAEKYQLLQKIPQAQIAQGVGGTGIGGETQDIDARVGSLKIGQFLIKNPIISISQSANSVGVNFETGFIGGKILQRFTVTLDYKSLRMLLKPNAAFDEPYTIDLSGIEFMTEADNFSVIKIRHVRAGFPAAAAGLQENDIILTVDNREASSYKIPELAEIFRQAGKEYQLKIKRGDKIFSVKLKLKQII